MLTISMIKLFFKDFQINFENETFYLYQIKVSSNNICLPKEEHINEKLLDLSNGDRLVIEIKMDEGDPIIINSEFTLDEIKESLSQIFDQINIKEKDSIFYLNIKFIKKITNDSILNIYSLGIFINYLLSLDLKDLLSSFSGLFKNHNKIIFKLLDSDEKFYTSTLYFSNEIDTLPYYELNRHEILGKGDTVRYYLKVSDFPFIPEDFYLIKRSKNKEINILFDKLALTYALIYLADISDIEEDNTLQLRCNGYKSVNNKLYFNKLNTNKLELYYLIYRWVYIGGNLVDKIGLARNVITLYSTDNKLLNVSENIYETIKSNYNIYLKENLNQYIEIKNQVTQFLFDLSKKTNSLIDSFTDVFRKNIQWLITFYVSVFIFNTLAAGKIENIFTKDITYISYGILFISLVVLVVSTIELNMGKSRFLKQYDETEEYYSDLLNKDDLKKIFKNGKTRQSNLDYINKKRLAYIIAWIIVLVTMTIITSVLSMIS